jgi:hypothetical protein
MFYKRAKTFSGGKTDHCEQLASVTKTEYRLEEHEPSDKKSFIQALAMENH